MALPCGKDVTSCLSQSEICSVGCDMNWFLQTGRQILKMILYCVTSLENSVCEEKGVFSDGCHGCATAGMNWFEDRN